MKHTAPGRPAIAPFLLAKSMRDARAIGSFDDVLRDPIDSIRDRLNGKPRHYRIGAWDFACGAALGFLVGFAPFLAMLAWMEWVR